MLFPGQQQFRRLPTLKGVRGNQPRFSQKEIL